MVCLGEAPIFIFLLLKEKALLLNLCREGVSARGGVPPVLSLSHPFLNSCGMFQLKSAPVHELQLQNLLLEDTGEI